MKTFFIYFLPWLFRHSTRSTTAVLSACHRGFVEQYKSIPIVGLLITFALMAVSCLLTLLFVIVYAKVNGIGYVQSDIYISYALKFAAFSSVFYGLSVGICAAYEVFKSEQQELFNKLKD